MKSKLQETKNTKLGKAQREQNSKTHINTSIVSIRIHIAHIQIVWIINFSVAYTYTDTQIHSYIGPQTSGLDTQANESFRLDKMDATLALAEPNPE